MKVPDSSTSSMRFLSSGSRGAYCALTSTEGIFGTRGQSSGAPAAEDPVGRSEQNSYNDRDLQVAQFVLQPVIAGSERPAAAGEAEAEGRAAEHRPRQEAREIHLRDPGRDRDERAQNR